MYILYSLLLGLALLIALPWWLFQMRKGKYREGLSERLGALPARLKVPGGESVWIHAVSVGEVLAIGAVVKRLRERHPALEVYVSTTTRTGQALARERFGSDHVFYFPLDFPFAINPYLQRLRPRLVVMAETEFWPNLFRLVRKSGAKLAVVNARISDRSFPGYRRFKALLTRVLANVDLFLAQTALDAERLAIIGASHDRVQISGNLKFDITAPAGTPFVQELRQRIAASGIGPVVVCGSTVEGEEPLLFDFFKRFFQEYPQGLVVLAPRHPERFDSVTTQLQSAGMSFVRRSMYHDEPLMRKILLLDTIGELAATYSLAHLAFVGGSLVPRGGHNILEPAQFGVAVATGPHTENFRELTSTFTRANAVKVVLPQSVTNDLLALLADATARQTLGQNARACFTGNSGATERTVAALERLMSEANA